MMSNTDPEARPDDIRQTRLPEFALHVDQLRAHNCAETIELLRQHEKKEVGCVTVRDLAELSSPPTGVYIFFDDSGEPWYVGKATSRSFAERIPSHFDPRPDGWFGTLPKKVRTFASLSTYAEAIEISLSLHLLTVGVPDRYVAARLEKFLRSALRPRLNFLSTTYNMGQALDGILSK